MAGASLLTLLDDIATVLDDIALMSKVAAKKTASVLGDDLALNAQQVSGAAAEREIPIVLAVAKGSLKNKAILVPSALMLSAFIPWAIMPLLLVGGLYLCFEGAEKVVEALFPGSHAESNKETVDSSLSAEAYEKEKVLGAIRTDFILSAEIIVIALGTVQDRPLFDQVIVVAFIAVIMTIGVYGLVAGIVKLDDLGFYLERKSKGKGLLHTLGKGFILFAPKLMKLLTVIGTLAMFLVGGGIVVHNVPFLHHFIDAIFASFTNNQFISVATYCTHGILGFVVGLIVMVVIHGIHTIRSK
jgi:uncharacterized protein